MLKDWEDYVKVFKEFITATGVTGDHAAPEVEGVPCAACIKAKNMMRLVGRDQVRTLFDHVGQTLDTDSWQETLNKVSVGIKKQPK